MANPALFNALKKYKTSIIEQQLEGDLNALAKKYNRLLPPSNDQAARIQLYNSIKSADSAPNDPSKIGGMYQPWIKSGRGSFGAGTGAIPSASILWKKLSNSGRPSTASIKFAEREAFLAYLKHVIDSFETEQGDGNKGAGEEKPQEKGGLNGDQGGMPVDFATGELAQELWEPYLPNPDDLDIFAQNYDNAIPGIRVDELLKLITSDPTQNPFRTSLLEFKRKVRDGAPPGLSPIIQKEIFEAHLKLIGLSKEIQTDEKGNKYIDSKALTPEIKDLLSSVTARTGGYTNANKKSQGLYFGRRNGMLETVTPELSEFLADMEKRGIEERYGISLGSYTQPMCDVFKDVRERTITGEYTHKILNSSFSTEGNSLNRKLGALNEQIMSGLFKSLFAKEAGDKENMQLAIMELQDFINGVQDYADMIENNLPVAGILSSELPQETLSLIQEGLNLDELNDPAKAHVAYLQKHVNVMLGHFKKAGVKAVDSQHFGTQSTSSSKKDFEIKFQSPEDAAKFSQYLKNDYGLDINLEETLPISLKSYVSETRVATGTAHLGKIYNPSVVIKSSTPDYTAKAFQEKRDLMLEYMSSKVKSPGFKSKAKKGSEISSLIFGMLDNVFKPSSHLNPTTNNQLSYETYIKHLEQATGTELSDKQEFQHIKRKLDMVRYSIDYRKIEHIKRELFGYTRFVLAKNDPSLKKAFAYSDLMSAVMTEQDELIWTVDPQHSLMTSNHTLVRSLVDDYNVDFEPTGGGYNLVFKTKGGKQIGRISPMVKETNGRYYTTMGAVFDKEFLNNSGISIKDNPKTVSFKENTIRQIKKLFELIQEENFS